MIFNKIILLPSFYLILGFNFPMILFYMNFIQWDSTSLVVDFIFGLIFLSNIGSLYLSNKLINSNRVTVNLEHKNTKILKLVFNFFGVLGILGYVLYINELCVNFGGINGLLETVKFGAEPIRLFVSQSVGTQLTYFGWIYCTYLGYYISIDTKKTYSYSYIILSVLLSLSFVDRIKPLTLLFFSFFGFIYGLATSRNKVNIIKLIKWSILILIIVITIFVGVASVLGKIESTNYVNANSSNPALINIIYYFTGGFAYFNNMVEFDSFEGLNFAGVLYPILKFYTIFSGEEIARPSVLEFKDVPFTTNVATFLEPIYSSFGFFFTVVYSFFYPFIMDLIAIKLIKKNKLPAIVMLSALCWICFFSFFANYMFTTPFYLITLIYVVLNSSSSRVSLVK